MLTEADTCRMFVVPKLQTANLADALGISLAEFFAQLRQSNDASHL
jgi:hypothetical protein